MSHYEIEGSGSKLTRGKHPWQTPLEDGPQGTEGFTFDQEYDLPMKGAGGEKWVNTADVPIDTDPYGSLGFRGWTPPVSRKVTDPMVGKR